MMVSAKESFMLKQFLRLAVILLPAAAVSAQGGHLPPEIYRARTVFLFCYSDLPKVCKAPQAMESIQKEIAEKGRWTVVSEAAQADLILVFLHGVSVSSAWIYKGATSTTTRYFTGLLVLKGGATPDWNAIPLYATGGANASAALQDLYDDVRRTTPFVTPSALLPTPSALLPSSTVEHPTMTAQDYLVRGRAFRQRGDLDFAIHDFTMALQLKPDFAEAQRELESAKKAKAAADCNYQLGCRK